MHQLLARQQDAAVDGERQAAVPAAQHHAQHDDLATGLEGAAQAVLVVGHARAEPDGAVRAGDLEEDVEDVEAGLGVDQLGALDDADQEPRQQLEPDVVGQLAPQVHPEPSAVAASAVSRVSLVEADAALFVRVGLAEGHDDGEGADVHGHEVGDEQRGCERRDGDDVGAAVAQPRRLEEAVEDARAHRPRALDGRQADVEQLVQDPHGQVDQQLDREQVPRLLGREEVDKAAPRVVQQEEAGLPQARGGGHALGDGPDEQAEQDGELRVARDGQRAADDQGQRVAREGDVVGVEHVEAAVAEASHRREEAPPPGLEVARLRGVQYGGDAVAVGVGDQEEGAQRVPEDLVGDQQRQEQLERPVLDAAQLGALVLAEVAEAAARVELRVEGDVGP